MKNDANWGLVSSLATAFRFGEETSETLPRLVVKVLDEGAWCRFVLPSGEEVKHETFRAFVEAPAPRGLGSGLDRLVKRVGEDPDARKALAKVDEEVERPVGANQHSEPVDNINTLERPTGTSQQRAARVLRRKRPDLLERVVEGELSWHAAMIEGGFRKRTATFYPDDVEHTVKVLVRHFDVDRLMDALVSAQGGTPSPTPEEPSE